MPEPDNSGETRSSDKNNAPSALAADLLVRFRKPLIILAHILVFAASLMLSFLLTSNMQLRREWLFKQFPLLLMFIVPLKLIIFTFFKQYQGWWRYVGISDLIGIVRASLISTIVIVALWFGMMNADIIRRSLYPLAAVAQGVFMLDLFCTIMLLGGLRMVVRMYHEEFLSEAGSGIKRLLIIGAGDAGEALLREIMRMKVEQYEVVGFIDDDLAKQGISIHGINVIGTVEKLPDICQKQNIDEIAIAIPTATHKELRRVVQVCQGTKIRFRTIPSITDIASGKLKVSQIRDVDINDLLGRDVVHLDLDMIEKVLKNKVILVTGAGGSIGSEMARQVCNFEPKLLLLVEQAENPLFFIERELRKTFPDVAMKAIVRNITDKNLLEQVFEEFKPQVVIHAAAHKHVPLMEINPGEAVKNNIIGTKVVAELADAFKTDDFVMISTDKAVNPTSIMGSTKRIAEMYIQDLNRTSDTHFITVRFGNVLGSNGSVVPIFKNQIALGGPVTVTHPEMQRYFMTIPEASQLVLQAATLGKGGEIFVLDMGEPVKIVELARELITLSGFRPGEDIEIVFTGTRPGEKLFEELSIEGEDMLATKHPKIAAWKNILADRQTLYAGIEKLLSVAKTQDHQKIVTLIKELVPEYLGNINNST
jgi:FlaA1/EpsC-like NDP-sugar epimerase